MLTDKPRSRYNSTECLSLPFWPQFPEYGTESSGIRSDGYAVRLANEQECLFGVSRRYSSTLRSHRPLAIESGGTASF